VDGFERDAEFLKFVMHGAEPRVRVVAPPRAHLAEDDVFHRIPSSAPFHDPLKARRKE